MAHKCLMPTKNCFWVVFNRSEGAIHSAKSKEAAARWRKTNRPKGTRLIYVCIPERN